MGSFIKKDSQFDDPDIIGVSELIKGRLYFITYKNTEPEETQKVHYFTAKDEYSSDENTEPINRVSLGTISQFIKTVNKNLKSKKYLNKIIVNYSTGSERKRSNAAVLVGIYAITHLNMSPDEVATILSPHTTISTLESLEAMQKGIKLGFINILSFNIDDFYSLDDVKLNWVVPNKFLMFSGPLEASNGSYVSPRRYITFFHHVGVQTIIRLCHIKYDANPFVDADIPHYDLNIAGSVPSDKVLEVFMELSEECDGVVVVHCREVLGRAACLVAAYLVKHYDMSATEAMAWVRICTSECILEAQKTWLKNNEAALQKAGGQLKLNSTTGGQWVRGICGDNIIQEDQRDKEGSSVEDVTAQLKNEIRVVESVNSVSDIKQGVENTT